MNDLFGIILALTLILLLVWGVNEVFKEVVFSLKNTYRLAKMVKIEYKKAIKSLKENIR